jgi:cell division cycle 20-like protein 1, cofactor of APC complex
MDHCDDPAATTSGLTSSDLSPIDRIGTKTALTPMTQESSNDSVVSIETARTPLTVDVSSSLSKGHLMHPSEESSSPHDYSSKANQSSSSSFRMVLPSPSRRRLDLQYAKRLSASSSMPQQYQMNQHHHHYHHHNHHHYHPYPSPPATNTATNSLSNNNDNGVLTPPEITRDSDASIFRPTSILTQTSSSSPSSSYYGAPFSSMSSPFRLSPREVARDDDIFPSNSGIFNPQPPNPANRYRYPDTATTSTTTTTRQQSYSSSRRLSRNHPSDLGASDRFIPSRATSNLNFNLWDSLNERSSPRTSSNSSSQSNTNNNGNTNNNESNNANSDPPQQGGGGANTSNSNTAAAAAAVQDDSGDTNGNSSRSNDSGTPSHNLHNVLLRSELLGENISPYYTTGGSNGQYMSSPGNNQMRQGGGGLPLRDGVNRLRFQSRRQQYLENAYNEVGGPTSVVNAFSLTPVGSAASQRLMAAPQKRKRRIAKVPFKVLDAPALQDDFYLNLVDWSSQNVLAVGLGSCVYLWSACTSKVTKLCDLAQSEDIVTSVSWAQRGTHLAVGTNRGEVQLWDTIKCKKVRTMGGHSARVGTLAWTGPILASGSRDRLIFLRDVRVQAAFTDRLGAHKQEVCGLRWSFDEPSFLASGGNDNQLHVVDSRNPTHPVHQFSDHTAAVKAIAWSPHQHGLLASGGGTADRCIRFWNTLSGTSLNCVDTGSQVCNLAWSQNCNEIVSTHGYSLNQIVVWRYPSMSKVVTLTGHTYRVLYLAMSPDGSTIVTGAGDETLRFWQVSPGANLSWFRFVLKVFDTMCVFCGALTLTHKSYNSPSCCPKSGFSRTTIGWKE